VEREICDYVGNNWSHRNSNKRLKKENLEAVPGRHSLDSLQETATLGTSHTIRKVLQSEIGTLSSRDRRRFKRSTRKKRSVTRDNNVLLFLLLLLLLLFKFAFINVLNQHPEG
jgi:hypothetical protein